MVVFKAKLTSISVLNFLLVATLSLWGFSSAASQCDLYLNPQTLNQFEDFIPHQNYSSINLFSNSLESFIHHNPDLDFKLKKVALLSPPETTNKPIEGQGQLELTRTSPQEKNTQLFDLKYTVLDSSRAIFEFLKKYRSLTLEQERELTSAKLFIEKNPSYVFLFTDIGLSLWTKDTLNEWLSDYKTHSLSPALMSEYIYRNAYDTHMTDYIYSPLAKKFASHLDEALNFQLNYDNEINEWNEGLEEDSLSFFFRSLFRHTLLTKRVDFLRAINKKTFVSDLKSSSLRQTLENLSMFPEYLYSSLSVIDLKLLPEASFMEEGGVVFDSVPRKMFDFPEYTVSLNLWRVVDDLQHENLYTKIVIAIPEHLATDQSIAELKSEITWIWEKMLLSLNLEGHKILSEKGVHFIFEVNENENGYEVTVKLNPIAAQQFNETQLMFTLYNRF